MAMKSKAQRRKFAELLVKGEISPEVYERWNRETGGKDLPEHVGARKKKKPTTKKKAVPRKVARKKTATKKAAKRSG